MSAAAGVFEGGTAVGGSLWSAVETLPAPAHSIDAVSTLSILLRVLLSVTLLVNGIGTPMAAHAHGKDTAQETAPAPQCHPAVPVADAAPAHHASAGAHAGHGAHASHAGMHHGSAPATLTRGVDSVQVTSTADTPEPMSCCTFGQCRCGCVLHAALNPTVVATPPRVVPTPVVSPPRASPGALHRFELLRPPAV